MALDRLGYPRVTFVIMLTVIGRDAKLLPGAADVLEYRHRGVIRPATRVARDRGGAGGLWTYGCHQAAGLIVFSVRHPRDPGRSA
jgi:hypothetical protein